MATNAYRQDLGDAWNPYQYATDETTQNLVNMFGGTAGKTTDPAESGIGFGPPPQNVIDFGGGYVGNAGLTQRFMDIYGPVTARRMFADMQGYNDANRNPNDMMLGIGTDPSLQGYNSELTRPTTFGSRANFGAAASPMYQQGANASPSGGGMQAPQNMGAAPTSSPMMSPQRSPMTSQPSMMGDRRGGFGGGTGQMQSSPLSMLMSLFGGGGGGMGGFGGFNSWGNPSQGNPFGMFGQNFGGFGNPLMRGGFNSPMLGGMAQLRNGMQSPRPWGASPNTRSFFPTFY